MKNLIIYLVLILFTNNIKNTTKNDIEDNFCPPEIHWKDCPDPMKVKPYIVVLEAENGARFYVPANIVNVNNEQFKRWYYSETIQIKPYYEGR
tara:strand:- start:113 stop:391 length:279 start_codon:yes stop_codon:yes gene_type:complete